MRALRVAGGAILLSVTGYIATSQITVPASAAQGSESSAPSLSSQRELLNEFCVSCHNERLRTSGLLLDKADVDHPAADVAVWEKVLLKLRTRDMPPPRMPRPDDAKYDALAEYLESALDQAAERRPSPGKIPVHRLNRTQYANAVRDLLGLDIDVESLLPADPSGAGFDNNAGTLTLSPMLFEKYLAAAAKVSRLAVGDPSISPSVRDYQIPAATVQTDRGSADLPVGSRGGIFVQHHFPLDAEYIIRVRLQRDRDGSILGGSEERRLHIRLDGAGVGLFTVGGQSQGAVKVAQNGSSDEALDDGLEVRLAVKAGPHQVAATFVKDTAKPEGVLVSTRQAAFFEGVGSLSVAGPYAMKGPGDTPSRRQVFVCNPSAPVEQERCASQIVTRLARRAYRRPIAVKEIPALLSPYRATREEGGDFERGIRMALQRILASPDFLFRIELDPSDAPDRVHRVSDLGLASRLSFFLWNSIPDEELLSAAERGELRQPEMQQQQVRRMLADPRAKSLVTDFVSQWLYLRNIESVNPDPASFPDFDENLRAALLQETQLFFESMLREDRSVLDLLRADYTFLNERLARHYGIPGIYGSEFRRVTLASDARRGLLGQGSVLTVTSYPNRTAPTLRGKWLLENLLGAPPPPPPPNIPSLKEDKNVALLTMRERMELHRVSPVCASCHSRMDPLGFALENFDGLGRWRDTTEGGGRIDASGILPDGTAFNGPVGLRQVLLSKEDQLVTAVTGRLLTYALGRAVEPSDMPAIRKIVRTSASQAYRWSSLIMGVVRSAPFQMAESSS